MTKSTDWNTGIQFGNDFVVEWRRLKNTYRHMIWHFVVCFVRDGAPEFHDPENDLLVLRNVTKLRIGNVSTTNWILNKSFQTTHDQTQTNHTMNTTSVRHSHSSWMHTASQRLCACVCVCETKIVRLTDRTPQRFDSILVIISFSSMVAPYISNESMEIERLQC